MLRTLSIPIGILMLAISGCSDQATEQQSTAISSSNISLDNDAQKLSYGLGLNIGIGVSKQGIPNLDMDSLVVGIRDAVNGIDPKISDEELQAVFIRVGEKENARLAEISSKNDESGKIWLEQNSKKDGVITTSSGLQYTVLTEGTGEMPVAESVVKTHYHGTLINGTVFDSSVDRGEPSEFALNQVIPGWTEVLQLMKVGSKYRVFLPSSLAYGDYSPGPSIPPGSTLIFDIELIEIIK